MSSILHPDLTAAAIIALAALLCGLVMQRLRQPAIVGYILAGVVLGPSGLGLASNRAAITSLAEFGMLMLLFVIGLELDLRRFIAVWKIAVVATLVQIAGSAGTALLLRAAFGWSTGLALVLGFAVAVSSTAVVIKMLEDSGNLDSDVGRIIVGILVAQDMAVVPILLFIGGLDGAGFDPMDALRVGGSVIVLAVLLWLMAYRGIRLPISARLARDHDLVPLLALAWCLGAAALAGLADLSPAYGAFLAGLVLGNSAGRDAVLGSAKPMQTVLLMVFFLSIGLLVDLRFIGRNLTDVLTLLLMVALFKTVLNVGALRLLGQDWAGAFLAGAALAQIGEFSFLLAEAGKAAHLISSREMKLVVAVAVLSLALSPAWLASMRRVHHLVGLGVVSLREVVSVVGGREASAAMRPLLRLAWRTRRALKLLPPPGGGKGPDHA